ncbi:MAG: ADOP family duplicated permease [Gemmatimonadota bacterium]|nr:ADOP family duplicated permease [Gemmatimonadota bacterium]
MLLPQVLRSISRERGTSLSIVLTVAVGIAALTTAFGLADAALWRPPPFADAASVVLISSTHAVPRQPMHRSRWSYQRIQLLRKQGSDFTGVANFTAATLTLTGDEEAERLNGEFVSPEYFAVLQVRAERGRLLVADDDVGEGAHPVAVISYAFWMRHFAGDSAIVGKTVNINNRALTIVGVAPPDLRGLTNEAQIWIPTTLAPSLTYPDYLKTDQNFIAVVARLKADVSFARALPNVRKLGSAVFTAVPVQDPDSGQVSSATIQTINEARVQPGTPRSITILLAAVALLHLLACTNVASLLLGRAAARRRDMAIRTALGATPSRLMPVLVADSVVLVVVGAILGTLFAYWTSIVVRVPAEFWTSRVSRSSLSSFSDPAFGAHSLLFALVSTLVTLLLVIWAPATAAMEINIGHTLRDGARGFTSGTPTLRKPNVRGVIVAGEAALAVVLLVAGELMIDSFARMQRTDLGIDSSHLLTFDLHVQEAMVPAPAAPAYIARILASISSVPGVVSATVDGGAPVSGSASSTLYIIGRPMPGANDAPPILRHYVGPDHFKTLGIPVIQGRVFADRDVAGQPRVAVISRSAVRKFWPTENPIGQRVWFGSGSNFNGPDSSAEIIGIVGDVAYRPLDQHPFQEDFYTPYMQFTYASRTVFLRTAGDPLAAATAVRRAVRLVNRDVAILAMQTMPSLIGKSWVRQRFDAMLFGGFAVVALLLSATGIFAVVSYSISQRTRELGIRLALGATNIAVMRLVIREGMVFPIVGLLIGLVISMSMGTLIASSLYEVSPTDPWVFARTFAMLFAASLIACLVPALRAIRVDPLIVMRGD